MLKTLWLLTLIVVFSLWATAPTRADSEELPAPSPEVLGLVQGNTEFALALYGQMRQPQNNLFLSPLSVSMVMAMLAEGAKGETLSQLNKTLGFPSSQAPQGQSLSRKMTELSQTLTIGPKLEKDEENPAGELSLANSLWPRLNLKLKPQYLKALGDDPAIYPVDYEKKGPEAVQRINDWVAQQTKNKITDLITRTLPTDTNLILVNAVYFLGNWRHPFNPAKTAPQEFTLANGKKVKTPFLRQENKFKYLALEEGQILELPYQGLRRLMWILLPAAKNGDLNKLELQLTPENLAAWQKKMSPTRVEVALPKFNITWGTQSLRGPLEKLGLTSIFGDSADFSALTDDRALKVSDIIHKAFVSVDEKGTEAAAATAGMLTMSAPILEPPVPFVADRPFIFLILDKTTNSILFLGRLMEP
ncbi:MAG: serpin family protein [Deltaproteobacteria bacterium]|jgi:serpin B|nr:serpin family protein [Deltaproteobacteria bacterium]